MGEKMELNHGPWWWQLLVATNLGVFVGAILVSAALQLGAAAAIIMYPSSPWPWVLAASLVMLSALPLAEVPPPLARRYIRFCCGTGAGYFPVRTIFEDEQAFKPDQPYVIGLEPHSALPVAMPAVFGAGSVLLPSGLRGRCHGLASSVCFTFPLVRHLWWWLGLRPVTKGSIRRLLQRPAAVVLVPGGVQECLLMEPGRETAFLRSRLGFVRMAIEYGAPLIPVFAFGQSDTYTWRRPPGVPIKWLAAMSRRIGFVPLLMLGRWFSPLPKQSPMTVVFAKPIIVPQIHNPSKEQVQPYLDKFIASLEDIFQRYKETAGYPDTSLVVL